MKFGGKPDYEKAPEPAQCDYEQLEEFLDICAIHLAIFNDWEIKFIDDMILRVECRDPLSIRQLEVISSLYDKARNRRS